jgi:dolichol kinase
MVFNILTLPVTVLFIGNAFGQMIYFLKLRKKFPKSQNIYDFISVFLLWIIAGFLYPFIYSINSDQIRFHQAVTMNILCIYGPILVLIILLYQKNVVLKYSPNVRNDRTEENYFKSFDLMNPKATDKKYSIKTDLHRKMFHLLPALFIIILWKFSVEIWAGVLGADLTWGVSGEDYGRFLIVTVGFGAIFIFAAIDYVRLSFIFEKKNVFHLFPTDLLKIVLRSLKRNELRDFAKPVGMALSLIPIFFFFPFEIFAAAALLASLGDAAASIAGISIGKHHFPKNSYKTIEGYISGFLVASLVSIFSLWILGSTMNFNKIIIISIGGAITFLIIDLLSLKIDDNILNPLACAPVMWLLYLIL